MIDLLLIALITVLIVDVSGFIGEIEDILGRWLKCKAKIPKPFSCSLCMTWWVGLIYLLFMGEVSLVSIATLLLVSCSTTIIQDCYWTLQDALALIPQLITKLINKIK